LGSIGGPALEPNDIRQRSESGRFSGLSYEPNWRRNSLRSEALSRELDDDARLAHVIYWRGRQRYVVQEAATIHHETLPLLVKGKPRFEDRATVLRQAHVLRDAGCRVEYALRAQSVAKQMKLAAARGARCAIVIGPDERESGAVILRTLHDGGETRVPFGEIAARLHDGAD